MTLWPAHWSPDIVIDLARDIVLCSQARYFTLTVPLSIRVYKWVLVNLMYGGGGGGTL